MQDQTHDGRSFRILTVIDEYTKECLALPMARRLRSDDVLACLTDLFTKHGPSDHIRSDNGPEFVATAVREWLATAVREGWPRLGSKPSTLRRGAPGKTATTKALTVNSGTSC